MDAAHFVLAPFLGWLWCAARLFVRGQSGRQRYNVLGAIEPLTGRLFRICNTTYINRQSVCFQASINSCLDSLAQERRASIISMLNLKFQRFNDVTLLTD
jgi:hypothetical protein